MPGGEPALGVAWKLAQQPLTRTLAYPLSAGIGQRPWCPAGWRADGSGQVQPDPGKLYFLPGGQNFRVSIHPSV